MRAPLLAFVMAVLPWGLRAEETAAATEDGSEEAPVDEKKELPKPQIKKRQGEIDREADPVREAAQEGEAAVTKKAMGELEDLKKGAKTRADFDAVEDRLEELKGKAFRELNPNAPRGAEADEESRRRYFEDGARAMGRGVGASLPEGARPPGAALARPGTEVGPEALGRPVANLRSEATAAKAPPPAQAPPPPGLPRVTAAQKDYDGRTTICADGARSPEELREFERKYGDFRDSSGQKTTAYQDPLHGYAKPLSQPYVVRPGGSGYPELDGVQRGDMAVVYNPRTGTAVDAFVGDVGPKNRFGEISVKTAEMGRDLGWDVQPHPQNGGTSEAFQYYFLKNSGQRGLEMTPANISARIDSLTSADSALLPPDVQAARLRSRRVLVGSR